MTNVWNRFWETKAPALPLSVNGGILGAGVLRTRAITGLTPWAEMPSSIPYTWKEAVKCGLARVLHFSLPSWIHSTNSSFLASVLPQLPSVTCHTSSAQLCALEAAHPHPGAISTTSLSVPLSGTRSHTQPPTAFWLQQAAASKSGHRMSTVWFTPHMYHEAILEHVYKHFSIIFSFVRLIGPVGEQANEKMGSWVTLSQKANMEDRTGSKPKREAVLKDWPPLKCIPMNSSPGVKYNPITNIRFWGFLHFSTSSSSRSLKPRTKAVNGHSDPLCFRPPHPSAHLADLTSPTHWSLL